MERRMPHWNETMRRRRRSLRCAGPRWQPDNILQKFSKRHAGCPPWVSGAASEATFQCGREASLISGGGYG